MTTPSLSTPPDSLLAEAGLSPDATRAIVADALDGADDGELFLEVRRSESLLFDNGRLKSAAHDVSKGFGLRAGASE